MTLKSTEWTQYDEAALTDKYPQFQFGWFPDYPDADDYAASFWAADSFLNDHYSNPEIDKLLAIEQGDDRQGDARRRRSPRSSSSRPRTRRRSRSGRAARSPRCATGSHGVEDTFDPAYLFRLWVITKD